MRRLTVLRHGHAFADAPGGRDADRALSPQGLLEATRAGRELLTLFGRCDLLLASTAARTRQTAQAVLETGFAARHSHHEDALYLASAQTLRELLARCPQEAHVLLVGHNPGLSELVAELDPAGSCQVLGTGQWRSLEGPQLTATDVR